MKSSTRRIVTGLGALAALGAATPNPPMAMAQDQEIGFIEDFALAEDREAALAQLIPGTEEFYYFHALQYQNTGRFDELREMLGQWEKRFPSSGLRDEIVNRQALIGYADDPKGSLDHLRRNLGLNFNHQQEGKAREQAHPSTLDPAEIAWEKFLEDALRGTGNLGNLQESAFFPLMASGRGLTDEQRRDLLSRASLPDLPGLVPLIGADLGSKESRGFGEFGIHRALTRGQLDELRGLRQDLIRNENFVHTYLAKLRPGADTNVSADPEAREAWLDRAWSFVKDLDPAFNSLKAHVLYQRLVHDQGRGIHDAERFLAYVKLPRNVPYIRPEWRRDLGEQWRFAADPGRDFGEVTGMPPIVTDEPLVRAYLLHFFVEAENTEPYDPWFAKSWLQAVFAEAKIVNGIGDPEQWASLLSPEAYQALKERVDIEFDAASPERFAPGEAVKLRLHVKNVQTLIVKVFEINTLNAYLERGEEISTDLDLDGLVANHERTVEFDEPPARRVARDFEFPEIEARRGVWVVEFIGGSKSSRAVIRKGGLHALTATVSAGQVVTVLDEAHQPVAGGGVWVNGRRFACDEQGRAVVPFSTDPGARTLVIEDGGGFAALSRFGHDAEAYALAAGIHVEREALRSGGEATIAVRPTLTVAGQPISLSKLEQVRLVLTSTDLDGIVTTGTVADFPIASDREATHAFRVPDRLASLEVRLVAKVKIASEGGREIELADAATFQVNEHLRSDRVDDLYLSRFDDGFVVEFLGRTGEPEAGENLNVTLRREGFNNTRSFTLKTDAAGAVNLGALDGITEVVAAAPGGHQRSWNLPQARRTQPGVIHSVAGTPVRVPFFGALVRDEVAMLAVSPGGFVDDSFDALSLEDGFLVADDLAAGDYRLLLKAAGQAITLRVAAGETAEGHVFNDARILELKERAPSHLAGIEAQDDAIVLRIANADALTRVHVVATRFLPDFDAFGALGGAPRPGLSAGRPGRLPNLFASGRKIGDEFRYILERRYADKLPGNLLERPEILLNPWAVRDTEAGEEQLAEGEEYRRKAPGEAADAAARLGEAGADGAAGGRNSPRSVDFLAEAPAVLLNLDPGEDGVIRIGLDALGDRQQIHVLVVDPDGASYEQVALADRATAIRDLRLVEGLDPQRHFTEQDSVTMLAAGESLEIPDLLTARFEVFDHLGAAYRYLLSLRDDPVLREFAFILDWPNLDAAQKRAKFSQFASHELSFFVAMKDPEFFREVVAPFVGNKKDPTFLDDYLVGADLGKFFAPFEYARLNAPERILLARRFPGRSEAVALDLRDRIALLPPDPARADLLFEGALASFGMDAGRGQALEEARRELREQLGSGVALNALAAESAAAAPEAPSADARPGGAATRSAGVRRSLQRARGAAAAESETRVEEEMEGEYKLGRRPVELAKGALADEDMLVKEAAAKDAVDPFSGDEFALELKQIERLYRAIETTREWAENNYHHLPIESHTWDLITENRFWLDFARHQGEGGFGSRHLGEAARSFHEMMLALAVLDLPFTAPEHETRIDGGKLTFTAGGRAMVFHREIREAGMAEEPPPLLVSQSWFRADDRFRIENGEQVDKFVADEFVAGVVYGGQVVVTNPTSSRQKLDVLIQIPRGAIPVLGNRATGTLRASMEPYTTQRFEVFFYFPTAGRFACFPAHVSREGEVVAHAEGFEFNVVDEPSQVDETSWAFISQWGTGDQVLAFLSTGNLHAIDLTKIAWRCRESRDFLGKVVDALELRGVYDGTLYAYGIFHDDPAIVRQFLLMEEGFLDTCGLYLASDLVTIDPIERRAYQHLEYKPLVNNRAHALGGENRILNARIREQYLQLMRVLSQKAGLDAEDHLSVIYYLFLQDRASEAIARLAKIDGDALPTRIQLDYFRAYAAFYASDVAGAREIAGRYAAHPVDRWRERFAAVLAQADEIEGAAPAVVDEESRDQQQARLAAEEPALDLAIEGTEARLTYANLGEVEVHYYEMDLEFLFSTNPFVSSEGGQFSVIRPNRSETIRLPEDRREHVFQLPRDYQSKNVLVEVVGGGKKRSQAVYANELQNVLSEGFGILTVRHAADGRALPRVYVKVYAMTDSGAVFYKDGYTDLRGKFDYASVSTSDIAGASKFSILVMSDEHGATVMEAPVPAR